MNLRKLSLLSAIAALTVVASTAMADITIVALNTRNTGQQTDGMGNDLNWNIVSYQNTYGLPSGQLPTFSLPQAAVLSTVHPAWKQNTADAFWVATNPNGAGDTTPPGMYDYRLTFSVPLTVTGPITVSGSIVVDNTVKITSGSGFDATGYDQGSTGSGNQYYVNPLNFSFTYNATPGTISQIDFFVNNANDGDGGFGSPNPSGIQVSGLSITGVPEMSDYVSWSALLLAALIAGHRTIGGMRRKAAATVLAS